MENRRDVCTVTEVDTKGKGKEKAEKPSLNNDEGEGKPPADNRYSPRRLWHFFRSTKRSKNKEAETTVTAKIHKTRTGTPVTKRRLK